MEALVFVTLLTLVSVYCGIREMWKVLKGISEGNPIEGSELHSLAHVGAIGTAVALALALAFTHHHAENMMEIFFFNAFLIFVLFPHFVWERKTDEKNSMGVMGDVYELHEQVKRDLVGKTPEEAREVLKEYRRKVDELLERCPNCGHQQKPGKNRKS